MGISGYLLMGRIGGLWLVDVHKFKDLNLFIFPLNSMRRSQLSTSTLYESRSDSATFGGVEYGTVKTGLLAGPSIEEWNPQQGHQVPDEDCVQVKPYSTVHVHHKDPHSVCQTTSKKSPLKN